MFVQALAEYADRHLAEQLQDESWEEKPVPYLISVGHNGQFVAIIPRTTLAQRGKKQVSVPLPMLVPKSPVPRNSGLYPLLAADDIKYVLGVGPWTTKGHEENNLERHRAFVDLLSEAAQKTGDATLAACVRFYARPDQVELARMALANATAGTLIGLSVDEPVTARRVVRQFWRDHYRLASQRRVASGGTAECLISGQVGLVAPTHDKVKGLASLGGQPAGVALMSFDKDAFQSYGWEQNANSPVSPERANAYVSALNHLLRPDNGRRRDVAGVAYVFWTRQPEDDSVIAVLEQPDDAEVRRLLEFDHRFDPDPNKFYMAGLTANGARLVIQYWVTETLGQLKTNLQGWFEGLRIAGAQRPPAMWQIRRALARDGEVTAAVGLALIRRAIEGAKKPMGFDILAKSLNRLRSSPDLLYDSAALGLIRLCVNDRLVEQGDRTMTETLDEGQNHAAYLCGRLLAVYDNLQDAVYRMADESKVNNTVADRYYSLASTNPSVAFPKIVDLGMKHLRKLRREARGIQIAIDREIGALQEQISTSSGGTFPKTLDLVDQGRFALGYYHQRAHALEQVRLRKLANVEQGDKE